MYYFIIYLTKIRQKANIVLISGNVEWKFFYKTPTREFFGQEKELTIRGDTILSHTLPSAQGRGSYDKYVKEHDI